MTLRKIGLCGVIAVAGLLGMYFEDMPAGTRAIALAALTFIALEVYT